MSDTSIPPLRQEIPRKSLSQNTPAKVKTRQDKMAIIIQWSMVRLSVAPAPQPPRTVPRSVLSPAGCEWEGHTGFLTSRLTVKCSLCSLWLKSKGFREDSSEGGGGGTLQESLPSTEQSTERNYLKQLFQTLEPSRPLVVSRGQLDEEAGRFQFISVNVHL